MDFTSVYFLGAGGIGMSALVRYFLHDGRRVAGYDLTETDLTRRLAAEGAELHYADDVSLVPDYCRDAASTLVVVTPAIPATHSELRYFTTHGFRMMKRSEVLGLIVNRHKPLCVAGTHGKTTTSTIAASIAMPSSEAYRSTMTPICSSTSPHHSMWSRLTSLTAHSCTSDPT